MTLRPSPPLAPLPMLRPATPADAPALAALGRHAFVTKFGHIYSAENLARFLDESHSVATVAAQIADPAMKVAVMDGAVESRLAGFCKIVRHSTLPRHTAAQSPAELKQLYTDPDLTGRGLGAQLMVWALAQAAAWGADELQLSVYAHNPDAQRFYRRFGMDKVADITFAVGDHIDPEFLFARAL